MTIFGGALLLGLSLPFVAAVYQIRRERARALDFSVLELEPNCLLTRHPLVFLAGPRSLFKIFDHWNRIPRFLREHGYEVLVLEPPAGLSLNVQASLIRALDDLPEAGHLIADSSLETTLDAISRNKHPKVVSLTRVRNRDASGLASACVRVDAASLRPPAYPIETFEVSAAENSGSRPARLLLAAHNLLMQARGQSRLDAVETADLTTSTPWEIERSFLRLAVSLAERDVYEGHQRSSEPCVTAGA